MGTQPSLTKRGRSLPPKFSAHFCCGQTAECIKMPLGIEVGLKKPSMDFVFDGRRPSPLSPERRRSLQFSAHVYCSQTAAWVKMPLGTEVGLGPDDIVLDGDPAPPSPKGAESPPQFSAHVYCGQTAGWIKMTLAMEVGLNWSRPHCATWGHSSPPPKRDRAPNFWPMSIVAKRLDGLRRHLVRK